MLAALGEYSMTEDMQSRPRCHGVLAKTASAELSHEPYVPDARPAWDSLAMLLVCIVFWTVVVTLALL
jgi:hypothetical protein